MFKNIIFIGFTFFVLACSKDENKSNNGIEKTPKVNSGFVKTPKTIDQQFSYAYTFDLMKRMKMDSIILDEDLIIQAVHDVFKDSARIEAGERQQIVNAMQDTIRIRSLAKSEQQAKDLVNLAERISKAQIGFLEKIRLSESLNSSQSGLLYKIIKNGKGRKVQPDDIVEVNIIGTFADGTEFDNTYKSGQPLNFPVIGMFKGWTEAISMLNEGSKAKFVFPPELAFGNEGAPPKIPADAIIVFEVEVMKLNGKYDPSKIQQNKK